MADEQRKAGRVRRALAVLFERKGSAAVSTAQLGGSDLFRGAGSKAGQSVTTTSAMRLSAAWGCMRILSETVGSLPWGLFQRDSKGNAVPVRNHSLSVVLTDTPNATMHSGELREYATLQLCQDGNAYSFIDRLGKDVVGLRPIPFELCTPKRKQGGNTRLGIPEGTPFYSVKDRGQTEDLPMEKIFHVRGWGSDGLRGLSPIGAAREVMGFAMAAEEFGSSFFARGAMPAGTVSYPGWLTKEQKAAAQEALNEMVGGLGNAHQVALFQGGMKPEPWQVMNLKDMEFLMLRQFSVPEVCRFYRVPPHMVADLSRATFSNIEQMSLEFVQFTLMPYFTRFEHAVGRWLLTPEERAKGLFLRFNFEGLLRGDSASRASFLIQMVNNGLMTRNEARGKENLGRADEEGMDSFTVQGAMIDIERVGEAPEPAPAPNPKPEDPADESEDDESGKRAPQIILAPNLAISVPESLKHEVDHKVKLESVAALKVMTDDVRSEVSGLMRQLHRWWEQMRVDQSALAMRIEQKEDEVASALRDFSKQKRRVVVGGEEFISEPVSSEKGE